MSPACGTGREVLLLQVRHIFAFTCGVCVFSTCVCVCVQINTVCAHWCFVFVRRAPGRAIAQNEFAIPSFFVVRNH